MNKQDLIKEMFVLVTFHNALDVDTFTRMNEILDGGITIDECISDSSKKVPIMSYALACNKFDVVYYLLEKGGDPSQAKNHGYNLLHDIALKHLSPDKEKRRVYLDLIKTIIDGSDNPIDLINSSSVDYGDTVLHLLICTGVNNLKSIKYLIENGADVHVADNDGDNLLHYTIDGIRRFAVNGGDNPFDLIDLLLKNGADVNVKNNDGISFATAIYKIQEEIDDKKILTELISLIDYRLTNAVEIRVNNTQKNKLKYRMRNRPKIGGVKI